MTAEPRCLTLNFGNAQQEYAAATSQAAMFDVSNRAQIELTGPDRKQFLHNFCTNNITAMQDGSACEAFLLNAKGRMLGHILIFNDDRSTWVDSVPGQAEFLNSHLEKYHLLEDFRLVNRTDTRGEFYVTGPQSAARLAQAIPAAGAISELGDRTWLSVADTDGGDVAVKRYDLFGTPGFLVSFEKQNADKLWQALVDQQILPAGSEVFQSLRIENAVPAYGSDLTDDNLAQEACRTAEAISFEKGCYLGQEPVARLNALGHVNREITRFTLDSAGDSVGSIAIQNPTKPEKEVGAITSVGWSWQKDCPIGLGLLRTQFREPGTQLSLADGRQATVI